MVTCQVKKNEVGNQLAREQGDKYLLSDRTAHAVAIAQFDPIVAH